MLVKNDAEVAFCAQDAVPNSDPVIPAVTVKEPVIIALPLTSKDALESVFPILIPVDVTLNISELVMVWDGFLTLNIISPSSLPGVVFLS